MEDYATILIGYMVGAVAFVVVGVLVVLAAICMVKENRTNINSSNPNKRYSRRDDGRY